MGKLNISWSGALLLPLVAMTGCGYPLVYWDARAERITAAEGVETRYIRLRRWVFFETVPVVRMSDGVDAILRRCRAPFGSKPSYRLIPYEVQKERAVKIARQQCLEDAELACEFILNDDRATFALMDQIVLPDESVIVYARCRSASLAIEKLRATPSKHVPNWEDLE